MTSVEILDKIFFKHNIGKQHISERSMAHWVEIS